MDARVIGVKMRFALSPRTTFTGLIHPRLRRDVLHVVGHGVIMHRAVVDRGLAGLVDPRQRVLHPVLVVTLAWLDGGGKTAIDYRPVHDYTMTNDVQYIPPKARVY